MYTNFKGITVCKRCGTHTKSTLVPEYACFCPKCYEDLFKFETEQEIILKLEGYSKGFTTKQISVYSEFDPYVAFIMGCDSLYIREIFDFNQYGMDGFYDYCVYLAKCFELYDNGVERTGDTYTAVMTFLEKYKRYILAVYNKGDY